MAKADYKCPSCGEWVRVTGINRADADRKAQWSEATGKLCYECYSKIKAAAIEEERRAALEAALAVKAEAGLPEMVGSEKQIAWAETIRAAQREKLLEALPRAITPQIEAYFREEIDAYLAETSAHRWIERRDNEVGARWLGQKIYERAMTEKAVAEQLRIAMVAQKMHAAAQS